VYFVLNTVNSKTEGCAMTDSLLSANSQNNRASNISIFRKRI